MVDLSDLLWSIKGDIGQMWLHGGDKVRIELGDEIVVVLLLGRMLECRPWQIIDVPCVAEVDIWEA